MSDMLSQIPPAAYPLAVGLFANSGLFFGNLGLTLAGPLPIIKGELGASTLSVQQKVAVWRLFFDKAATLAVGGTILSAVVHLGSIPLLPTSDLKSLASLSAVLSLSILPYTGYAIMPTIRRLKQLDQQDTISGADEAEAERLIRKWDTLHKVRYVSFASAWAVSLVTLVGLLRY